MQLICKVHLEDLSDSEKNHFSFSFSFFFLIISLMTYMKIIIYSIALPAQERCKRNETKIVFLARQIFTMKISFFSSFLFHFAMKIRLSRLNCRPRSDHWWKYHIQCSVMISRQFFFIVMERSKEKKSRTRWVFFNI